MPLYAYAHTRMCLQSSIVFRCLPIIKINSTSLISRNQKLPVVAKINWTSISSAWMWGKFFWSYSSKISSFVLINNNLIIWRLTCKVLSSRMQCCCCNSVHLWLWYMLCNNRNTEFPYKKLFVIRTSHKFILLNKSYCIDCS
jgi:hypothetical protein